jgi:hypothetical protein
MSTESARKRAVYVAAFMETGSKKRAMHASGLGPHAHKRIIQQLRDRHTLEDAPRTGAPIMFTAAVMDACLQKLLTLQDEASGLVTGSDLHMACIRDGTLWEGADYGQFLKQFHVYVKSLGHQLNMNSKACTFFLAKGDIPKRYTFGTTWVEVLSTLAALDHVIFIDETTIEESPHPKGEHPHEHITTFEANSSLHDHYTGPSHSVQTSSSCCMSTMIMHCMHGMQSSCALAAWPAMQ